MVRRGRAEQIAAEIWFRAFGVQINTGYLADGHLTSLTEQRTIPVTDHLNVQGYDHVYAIGDIANLADPKMASYAMEHAATVATNIKAQLVGDPQQAVHTPTP